MPGPVLAFIHPWYSSPRELAHQTRGVHLSARTGSRPAACARRLGLPSPDRSGLVIALLNAEQPNAKDGTGMSERLSIHRHIKHVIEMEVTCSFQPAPRIIFHCRKIFRRRKET